MGFGAAPGFACIRFASFKPFWPLALLQQAPPAIIFAALRRFRGPAVFLGPRTSSRPGAPFWPSGLTLRSSGPAFCGPLTLAYKGFPTFASAIHPELIAAQSTQANGFRFSIQIDSQPSVGGVLMLCGKRCGRRYYKRSFLLPHMAADPDERRAPGAPFVSRAWGDFSPGIP